MNIKSYRRDMKNPLENLLKISNIQKNQSWTIGIAKDKKNLVLESLVQSGLLSIFGKTKTKSL